MRNRDASGFKLAGERGAGERRALIRVEYPRLAVSCQSLLQRFDAKPAVDGVRQPPSQNRPAGPIDDRHEIQKAVRHRDSGDVGSPQLVRLGDRQAPQQVGIYPVSIGSRDAIRFGSLWHRGTRSVSDRYGAALLVPGRGTKASIPPLAIPTGYACWNLWPASPITRISRRTRFRLTPRPSLLSSNIIRREPEIGSSIFLKLKNFIYIISENTQCRPRSLERRDCLKIKSFSRPGSRFSYCRGKVTTPKFSATT